YGNWEILGYTMATLGFKTYSVARPIDNPHIDAWLLGVRQRKGQVILSKRGVTTTAQDVLKNGGVLGLIADQNAGPKGMFVPFFGHLASTYKSIGLLAIEYQVPVIIGYARRCGDRFEFDVPVGQNCDVFDRFCVRMEEMRQSVRILRQAVRDIPEGSILGKVPKVIKPPAGEAYHEIESSKGILGYYVVSDGSAKPYRVHVRRPSFINLGLISQMVRGWKIADVVAIFGSIDIVLGEVDC
ncbi:MAG: hypothetical protein M1543_01235, partial [Firmicutes bacterium]|nr:hypothetical protein [Bacillota bacterium]